MRQFALQYFHTLMFALSSQQNHGNNDKNMVFVEIYVVYEIYMKYICCVVHFFSLGLFLIVKYLE